MSLLLLNYPDPQGAPGDTIPQAYGWIEHLQLGFSDGSGRIVLWVHRSPEAAATWVDPDQPNIPPADVVEFQPGVNEFATLTEILTDAAVRAKGDPDLTPWDALRLALYGAIKAVRFPDAQDVP